MTGRQGVTLAEKEYGQFLSDNYFQLVADLDEGAFACSVFQNQDMLLAFTYQMGFGENLAIATLGSPVNVEAISQRMHGWNLIGELWPDAYRELHAEKKKIPYPHQLNREMEIALVAKALRDFVDKIRGGQIDIARPISRIIG